MDNDEFISGVSCLPGLSPGADPRSHERLAFLRPPQPGLRRPHAVAQHADTAHLEFDDVARGELAVELERRALGHRAGADHVTRLQPFAEAYPGQQLVDSPQLVAAGATTPGLAV